MSGRGGRGRGRGRGGRFGGRTGPIIRDEDGQMVVAARPEGPPPLFPKIETLPERPDVSDKENAYLLEKRRQLVSFYNDSAYYIEPKKEESASVSGEFQRYAEKGNTRNKRKALSDYLLLTPKNFPPELLGNARPKRTRTDGLWINPQGESKGLGRLDLLAKLEQKMGEKEDDDEEKEKKEGEEEDEEDRDIAYDDDEDMENDYTAFDQVDDDEGYDVDDGGDDDEATYNS